MRNVIYRSLLVILVAGALTTSGAALAGENMQGMNHAAMQGMNKVNKAVGVANSVDLQHGSINLTHGPVESLGWPGMTMDFSVKDKAMLQGIRAGQKVSFEIVKEGPGKFYISHITALK